MSALKSAVVFFRSPPAVQGIQDTLPAAIAMAIWGAVTGVAMVQSGLSTAQAIGMSLLVYAGSAQLASLPLFAAGAPWPIIWASALIVNLRFVIYSVAAKPFFQQFSWPKRLLHGVGMTDALAAEFLRRFDPAKLQGSGLLQTESLRLAREPIHYYRAASIFIWLVWQSSSIAGIVLAQEIPATWGLEFIATIALIAMLLPMMVDRAGIVCVVVAGGVAVLSITLPLNLGLLVSVLAGVLAAILADRPRVEKTRLSS
ncbi:MAG: AzlC family ABC transporter permease [Burkholderiales bacterium]